jgi:hypothetical protein
LLEARKNELETENHLKSIAERENGRLLQENLQLINQLDKLKEKRNLHEANKISSFFILSLNKLK